MGNECSKVSTVSRRPRMSNVFKDHFERLSRAISDPSSFSNAFYSRGILDHDEHIAITDTSSTRTTQQRTDSLLNTVTRRLDGNPQKLRTVVDVFYEHNSTRDIAVDIARKANLPNPAETNNLSQAQSHPGIGSSRQRPQPLPVALIVLAIFAVFAAVLYAVFPFSPTIICSWPDPISNSVQLKVREVKEELSVKEVLDNLKASQTRIGQAVDAGTKCGDVAVLEKMKMIEVAINETKQRATDMFSIFEDGARKTLTDLKHAWSSAVAGNIDIAVGQVGDVCTTTKTLAKQVGDLKDHVRMQKDQLHHAMDNLVNYHKGAKIDHERQLQTFEEKKQHYQQKLQAAEDDVQELEAKAHECAVNARKEMEAWENRKAKQGASWTNFKDDVLGIEDHKPYWKRRDNFLQEEQYYKDKAKEKKRAANQSQIMLDEMDEEIRVKKDHFQCTNEALLRMKDAVDNVKITTVEASLFEEGLQKDCEDLSHRMELLGSYWIATTKGSALSQVCDKTAKLFTKWQALLTTSSEFISRNK